MNRSSSQFILTAAVVAAVAADLYDVLVDRARYTENGGISMGEDLAAANLNRSYTLAASTIAVFTFTLFFLYPRFVSGEANAFLFQAAVVDLGGATFSFVFASLYYYRASLSGRIEDDERERYSRRGDRFWLLGYTLLFLAPSIILFSLSLLVVGSVWFTLWLVYLVFVIRYFPSVRT